MIFYHSEQVWLDFRNLKVGSKLYKNISLYQKFDIWFQFWHFQMIIRKHNNSWPSASPNERLLLVDNSKV